MGGTRFPIGIFDGGDRGVKEEEKFKKLEFSEVPCSKSDVFQHKSFHSLRSGFS